MSLYQENMNILKSSSKELYDKITNKESIYKSKVEEVYNDVGNCVNFIMESENGRCFLHSVYDKQRSIEMMYKDVPKDVENLIVFGIGQSLEYIVENFKSLKNFIIIEPDATIFDRLLLTESLKNMVTTSHISKLTVAEVPEHIAISVYNDISWNILKGVSIAFNPSYRTIFEDYYESFYQGFIRKLEVSSYVLNFEDYAQEKRIINSIRNILYPSMPFMELKDAFGDVPAVLVSAGPSLNYNIDYLRKIYNKAFIIAVGSAIKILESHGIKPHMRAAFDPDENERKVIEGVNAEDIPMLFSYELYHDIPGEYGGNLVNMVSIDNYISRYVYNIEPDNKNINDNLLVFVALSIAMSTYHALCKLGFKKIILIGQDLCYTDGELYANGSWEVSDEIMRRIVFKEVTNNIGERVYTDKNFLHMRKGLEDIIRMFEVPTINATSKGLVIDGAEFKDIDRILDEDMKYSYDIKALLDKRLEDYDYKLDNERKLARLSKLVNELREIDIVNDKRQDFLKICLSKKYNKKSSSKIRSDKMYLQSLEDKLCSYEAYTTVIKKLLESKLNALEVSKTYHGDCEYESFTNMSKLYLMKSYEIKKLLELMHREFDDIRDKLL